MDHIIKVNASAVSSLIGKNRFEPVRKTYKKMFEASDKGHYERILNLLKRKDSLRVAKDLIGSSGVQEQIEKAIGESSNACTLNCIKTSLKRTLDKIESCPKRRKVAFDATIKEVRSTVNKEKGIRNETKGLNQFEKASSVKIKSRNSHYYIKFLTTSKKRDYKIVGMIDGLVDDRIIEHKRRISKLHNGIYENERVQLMVYMFLTGLKKSTLVQTLDGSGKMLSNDFYWDTEEWKQIRRSLDKALDDYAILVNDETKLIELVKEHSL